MLVLLFAVAAVALTVLAALLAGVVVTIVTAVALVNAFVLVIGLRVRRRTVERPAQARWQPSAFRAPPELPEPADSHDESDAPHVPSVRAFRL
jgi:hypothetical protein